MRYLAHYEPPTSWFTVGQVLDLQSRSRGDRLIVTPSGQRLTPSAASQNVPGLIELNEQGIYDIRPAAGVGSARPEPVAVNLDPAESDLSALDPSELVASVTGHGSSTNASLNSPGTSRAGVATFAPSASSSCIVESRSWTENPM